MSHPPFIARPQPDRAALSARLEQAWATMLTRIDAGMAAFGDRFPSETCLHGHYQARDNVEWTPAFWSGQLWLAWEHSGNPAYRALAERHVVSFGRRIVQRIDTATHDLGFLYSLSCVCAWQLTGDRAARGIALLAAEALLERFNPQAGIIQAWGDLNDPAQRGRMIIDCNLNLPLLYWASAQSGDPRFADAARTHAGQAARYLVRPDSSTYHTFYMDTVTGEPRFGNTHQGYADDSCWARGQAWGILGFMLSWRYTGDAEMVRLAQRLADYFLQRLPEDGVCHWDLALLGTDALRDSSAAAIAVCGLLELSAALPAAGADRGRYEAAALHIMDSLTQTYLAAPQEPGTGLLKHSVYHLADNKGVDECCSWGDYFYMEALTRLTQVWQPYW
ncbi:glycoside hydrolase family 88 protein [Chimaeribacter arupi]|uniref:glycoside hydrolase family 88 protein n=1 Tax=Chimaeribacter arupi TaxID=2060066 RepID=UPI002711F32F|nr:glycoside hydrolase family 88 protein [Chimaeribacter arupi]WKZ93673.1 glycoside hydrolase family 88 protein [Chimaeribacter arupi]